MITKTHTVIRIALFAALCFFAVAAFGQNPNVTKPDQKFTVHKISSADEQGLLAVTAVVEGAVVDFEKAKAALDVAISHREGYVKKLTREVAAFEGDCKREPQPTANTSSGLAYSAALYVMPTREYRRVEIRGPYLLIAAGKEACSDGSSLSGSVAFIDVGSGDAPLLLPEHVNLSAVHREVY